MLIYAINAKSGLKNLFVILQKETIIQSIFVNLMALMPTVGIHRWHRLWAWSLTTNRIVVPCVTVGLFWSIFNRNSTHSLCRIRSAKGAPQRNGRHYKSSSVLNCAANGGQLLASSSSMALNQSAGPALPRLANALKSLISSAGSNGSFKSKASLSLLEEPLNFKDSFCSVLLLMPAMKSSTTRMRRLRPQNAPPKELEEQRAHSKQHWISKDGMEKRDHWPWPRAISSQSGVHRSPGKSPTSAN
jgi:hypothetical protein